MRLWAQALAGVRALFLSQSQTLKIVENMFVCVCVKWPSFYHVPLFLISNNCLMVFTFTCLETSKNSIN